MTTIKRYLLALAGFLVTGAAIGGLSDLIVPSLIGTPVPIPIEEIDSSEKRAFFWLNTFHMANGVLAFGVGAYLLRHNPIVPGLILYFALAIPSVMILYKIAVPADPSVTYFGILASNPVGWIGGLVAAVAGMLIGHRLSLQRYGYPNAV